MLALAAAVPLLWPAGVWPRKEPAVLPGQEGMTVLSQVWKTTAGNNLTFVQGVVTNLSDRTVYSVKVEIELLNKAGAVVATTTDQVQNVDAHKVWNFKALVIDPEAVSAQPAKVSFMR